MNRDEALAALQDVRDCGYLYRSEENELDKAIAALSSPCACGGKTPIATWEGWYPTYGSPDDQPARYLVLPREEKP